MRRPLLLATISSLFALTLVACDASSGDDETEPTFEQAEAIAKEQLAGADCVFEVKDQSSEDLEQMSLECLIAGDGPPMLYSIFQYTRDLDVTETDALIGGLTTADRYFENGNITVNPSGGDPSAVQLDAEQFTTALQEECDCGEVLTPTE